MARKKKSSGTGRANGAGRNLAVNRRARYDYEIVDRLEAGLVLTGTEIKSLRGGSVSLREGYVQVSRGEAYLHGVHIGRYKPAADNNHDPLRPRKLLLHAAEITRLEQTLNAHRYTAVPLRMYLSNAAPSWKSASDAASSGSTSGSARPSATPNARSSVS